MPITPLPSLDRTSPTFRTDLDTFFGSKMPAFASEANALETNVNTKEAVVTQAASDVAAARVEALSAAAAAAAASGATKWIAGTNYGEGVCTWSPSNYKTYRRKSPGGLSNTDPAVDAVGWEPLVVVIFVDTDAVIKGSDDPTKRVRFEVDGLSAGATRVLTVPDENMILAGRGVNTFTGKQSAPVFVDGVVVMAAASGAINLDLSLADIFDITLAGNITSCTFTNVPTLAANEELTVVLRIKQGATAYSFAFPTVAEWLTSGGTAPAVPAANKKGEFPLSKTGNAGFVGRKGAAN